MVDGNEGIQYTIPECIEPGFYLVRHEIIALHSAYEYPGAQFYPGCHQLEVTGSGTTAPSDLVAFPGAYSPDDPGIAYDAYAGKTDHFLRKFRKLSVSLTAELLLLASEYTIPGPALFTC